MTDLVSSGFLLFAHGARDPRWAGPFQRLQSRLKAMQTESITELAFLEFMQPDFLSAVEKMVDAGIQKIIVIPVFLGQGGHVLRELPELIEQAHEKWPQLKMIKVDAVGESDIVLDAIAQYCINVGELN